MTSKIAVDKPGCFALLNGDEAVARGAVEASVKVAASYPGTPATEILETLAEVAKDFGIYAEWSINEIVAAEVAAGASMAGVRSIVSMKHVGLNVAADAAMTLAYTGVEGGLIIAVCDDPALHSSQNEQDTRYFAVHSKLPLLDAGNPQEALDMAKEGFDLSERLHLPVILRQTTRVAHGKSRVRIGCEGCELHKGFHSEPRLAKNCISSPRMRIGEPTACARGLSGVGACSRVTVLFDVGGRFLLPRRIQ